MLHSAILFSILAASGGVLGADVGATGTLSSLDAGLGGTVTVANETALTISNYKLKDASAPALYWWGSTSDSLSSGFRINNEQVTKPASTNDITISLDAGHTAKDFSVVGLWCEKLSANFGQTKLTKDGKSSTSGNSMSGSSSASGGGTQKSSAEGQVKQQLLGVIAACVMVASFSS
ncbi:hypothetical protein HIM_07595 [Hirsutella minnesotensis 3608]|uniref:DM13 domain-containing protein n=1 Tax=Hirsutella minnesotensis 3608 TaxID=1043627 RepID=A0A0F7ZTF5_9HYPO|nr:hypothetical protein HIM_07595 [Hirsutella minnesotensis 3608]